jgi:hypothetical protein
VEQPEVLGNGGEQNSVDLPLQQEIDLGSTRVGTESELGQPDFVESGVRGTMEIPTAESGGLKHFLAGFLAAINESNKAFLSSIYTKINQLQESSSKLQASVETKLSTLQEESARADIRSGIEELSKRFEMENQNLSKEFSGKLISESRKLVHLVEQVQKDTEAELVAVKMHIQAVSSGLEDKLDQSFTQTNAVIDQLASKVIETSQILIIICTNWTRE